MFAVARLTVLVKILLVALLFDPRSFDTFTLPKSVASHGTALVLAALLVWLAARHGRRIVPWSPLHVGVGLVLLAFAVATPLALDPTIAVFGTFRRYLGLTQMLDNAVLYLGLVVLFRDAHALRLLTAVALGVTLPVALYAVVQRLGLDPFQFVQGTAVISTLGNPDIAGAFIAMLGITAIGLAVITGERLVEPPRIAFAAIGVNCMGVLLLTGTRAGVLAIGAGWLATIVLLVVMPHVGRTRRLPVLGITLLLGAGIIVSPIGARLNPTYLRADLSVLTRAEIYQAAIGSFLDRPVLGVGPDNFSVVYPSHKSAIALTIGNQSENSTHSLLLYVMTSAGVVGLVALVALIVFAVAGALRLARRGQTAALALIPLGAYLGQSLVTVNEVALDWIFWVSIGIIGAGTASTIGVAAARRHPVRPARAVGAVALGVALLATAVGIAPRLVAGEAMLGSEAFANAGRAPEAVPYGRDAVSADPRRAEMWSSLGAALYKVPARVASVQAFTVAAKQHPWDPLVWKNLAAAWSALGNRDAAFAAAARAVESDAYDGEARALLSSIAYDRGEYTRAGAEGERAIAYLAGADANVWYVTISAYVQLKDWQHAEPLARDAASRFTTSMRLRLLYAAILADQGKTADALSVIDAVLQDQPNNADALALKNALTRK